MKQPLTDMQAGIIKLLAMGKNTAEISAQFHITPQSVRSHINQALKRTGARSKNGARRFLLVGG